MHMFWYLGRTIIDANLVLQSCSEQNVSVI